MNLSLTLAAMAIGLVFQVTESFRPRFHVTSYPSSFALHVSVSDSLIGDGILPQKTTVAAVPKVAQRWRKSTKQLATLGPSSSDREMIEKARYPGAQLL